MRRKNKTAVIIAAALGTVAVGAVAVALVLSRSDSSQAPAPETPGVVGAGLPTNAPTAPAAAAPHTDSAALAGDAASKPHQVLKPVVSTATAAPSAGDAASGNSAPADPNLRPRNYSTPAFDPAMLFPSATISIAPAGQPAGNGMMRSAPPATMQPGGVQVLGGSISVRQN